MARPDDEPNGSTGTGIDRRAVIRGALVVGGVSALGGAAMAQENSEALVAEREWARTLARQVADQLPEAARQIPDLRLTAGQLEELRRVFENTLVTNMGCDSPAR